MLPGMAVAWVLLLFVSPSWGSGGRDNERTGPALVAAAVHRIGAQVCHQRPERSFHRHGRPLAVCGRCTGLYASGAIGLLAGSLRRRRTGGLDDTTIAQFPTNPRPVVGEVQRLAPSRHRVALDRRANVLALAAAPTMITWLLEMAGWWNPGTPLRALAAVPLGAAAGWLMARALDG
jgi:hypothetical protein